MHVPEWLGIVLVRFDCLKNDFSKNTKMYFNSDDPVVTFLGVFVLRES